MCLAQALAQVPDAPLGLDTGLIRAFIGLVIVLGVLLLLAALLRRGVISIPGHAGKGPMTIDGTLQLGDRRSLLIVSVDGRRLLVGATSTQVNLLTELGPGADRFGASLDRASGGSPVTPS